MKPHEYQRSAIIEIIKKFKDKKSVLLQLDTGGGKCLAKDTPVMMYDGSIKPVQDIKVGELIMGDDSGPREILSLARGREIMYKITPTKGDPFTVNESHILSLKVTGIKRGLTFNGRKYYKGDIIDISVKDYLNQSKSFKHCVKQYRVPVSFEKKNLELDPYFLGLWLGDGTTEKASITTASDVIICYLKQYCTDRNLGRRIEVQPNNKSIVFHLKKSIGRTYRNITKLRLKEIGVLGNKHIPIKYKTSSRDQRLQLLAGILDSDGYLCRGAYFDAIFKQKQLAEDVAYVARSLGLACYIKPAIKGCWYNGEYKKNTYYRISITGDCSVIPTKVHNPKKREQVKNVLVTGFDIECVGDGDYYGFEIDGNRRFLLGDFTVTHNTVVFSFLCKYWSERRNQKVLITCHREELVDQTCETLSKIGLSYSKITAQTKTINKDAEVFVSMIETVNNRLENELIDLPEIGLVISDECHVLVFDKVYKFFESAKILGVSATPVVLKKIHYSKCQHCKTEYDDIRDCCGEETEEWTRPFTMSSIYEDIVVGPPIDFLIEFGQLVREITLIEDLENADDLKEDKDGEFTKRSLDKVFSSEKKISDVARHYRESFKGKRTIIFNSTSKTNKMVYESLKAEGANVKLYDSVNKEEKISRRKLIQWFRDTPDAVLCNVNIFTAGFDCKEVECIVINRATMSLSLFLQMAGRGGRASSLIFKPNFLLIDLGGNVARFNEWSDATRDWKKIFFNGLGKPKARKIDAESVQTCDGCGAIYPKKLNACELCGHVPVIPEPREIVTKTTKTKLIPIKEIPPPNGQAIYEYIKSIGGNIHQAHKIMIGQVIDMFKYYGVTKSLYESAKESGELDKKVSKMIRKCYFVLLSKSDIHSGQNRTLKYLINKTKQKLEKFYEQ